MKAKIIIKDHARLSGYKAIYFHDIYCGKIENETGFVINAMNKQIFAATLEEKVSKLVPQGPDYELIFEDCKATDMHQEVERQKASKREPTRMY